MAAGRGNRRMVTTRRVASEVRELRLVIIGSFLEPHPKG